MNRHNWMVFTWILIFGLFVFSSGQVTADDSLLDKISITGALDVRLGIEQGLDNEDSSDVFLFAMELGVDARLSEWVNGALLLLWEEDETPEVVVDEGTITVGNEEESPFYLTAGKMYVPFGKFESNMVSDSLALEIGETNETAVLAGFEEQGFIGSLYFFNGDSQERADDDDQIEHFGLFLGYTREKDDMAIDIGAGYINSMIDSDGLSDTLGEIAEALGGFVEADFVSGAGLYCIFSSGSFNMIAEYIAALDEYEAEYSLGQIEIEPSAYCIEFGYTFDLSEKDAIVSLGYQGTDELGGYLPESRIMACFRIGLFEKTSVALEWAHDEDYDEDDGGTDDSADIITAQIAVEF